MHDIILHDIISYQKLYLMQFTKKELEIGNPKLDVILFTSFLATFFFSKFSAGREFNPNSSKFQPMQKRRLKKSITTRLKLSKKKTREILKFLYNKIFN